MKTICRKWLMSNYQLVLCETTKAEIFSLSSSISFTNRVVASCNGHAPLRILTNKWEMCRTYGVEYRVLLCRKRRQTHKIEPNRLYPHEWCEAKHRAMAMKCTSILCVYICFKFNRWRNHFNPLLLRFHRPSVTWDNFIIAI